MTELETKRRAVAGAAFHSVAFKSLKSHGNWWIGKHEMQRTVFHSDSTKSVFSITFLPGTALIKTRSHG